LTATLYTEGAEPPQSFLSFSVINHSSVYEVPNIWLLIMLLYYCL